ncbi:hypothetical protein [Pseudanabaena sp. 'Roaring Creek']|uniref:hypothetical protein n=1 Tax=Pseudanabaena sp. 'Roaring Creek' TaxID=1681830 RepID=UPI0006D8621B|nr:hypothetical protein [Pseudanabaena sp. 'Roaring Creek']
MKSTIVATFLAISGFAISGFALATPVNAQTAIVAALYQSPTTPHTEVRSESANINSHQIILAVNTTPEAVAIADNLIAGKTYDRIVTVSHKDNLACLVSGKGSIDGVVMCGFIDHE